MRDGCSELFEFPLRSAEPVGHVQTGQDGCSSRVQIAGASRDRRHQFVDLLREFLGFARIAHGRAL